ncbi:MAG: NFACT RNA binding domain-containing protein [Peptoniphilaceae bacterium]|nr:NFACT RNA binding domain-containing protein [Peptoniphilaceae bacterium]MDY6019630.1 NFACT RNA binding domain-containing protein [Anaerococcus sp.]
MSFDGIMTRAITNELKNELLGGKIQRISQPSKNDIVFNVYSRGNSYKLLISANNNEARLNLTNQKFENPNVAPNFCMVLRKHLNQGKIVNIEQVGLDRIVIFSISSIDEMGFDTSKKLILEIMGKYSNLILVDEDNKVIDSIKRVNEFMSSIRQVLPGVKYKLPINNKIDITKDGFKEDIYYFDQKLPDSTNPRKFFYNTYTGLSPLFAEEICFRAGIDPRINWNLVSESEKENLNNLLYMYIEKIKNKQFKGLTYSNDTKIKEFYCFKLSHLNLSEESHTLISQAVDKFYSYNKTNDRFKQIQQELIRKINTNIKASNKKIQILNDNIAKNEKALNIKKKGDLLAANIYKIEKGMKSIKVDDYYEPGKEIKIELDIMLTPWENVDSYYKRYKKIKNSISFAKVDLPKQEEYLRYLKEIKYFLEKADSIDQLEEIKEEMSANGLIKKKSKKKAKISKTKPSHYKTCEDSDIYLGKNSRQNDYITLKLANKNDYFFHVKDAPGSHLILKTKNLTDLDIKISAYLSALNSSLSSSNKVNVNYTEKKNVNKPKGAKPGIVYYENFKTISVDIEKFSKELQGLFTKIN